MNGSSRLKLNGRYVESKKRKRESEAKAILKNWIHKTRVEEVVDDLLEGLRKAMRTNALEQMDELRKPQRYIC